MVALPAAGSVSVGRFADNDVVLDDDRVSRHHVRVEWDGQIVRVTDLGSTNGAWMAGNVAQCGYCQVGQIMQASALLAEKPHPSDADIDAAMAGNLCRCGTYQRIRAAIKRAAEGRA